MDAAQLGRLIDDHAAALVLYARQWCAAPEDVVQDAFVALVQQPRLPEPVAPWLFRVVRNRAISAGRSERRRRRREAQAAPGSWFYSNVESGLEAAELRDALAALPPEQREVIVAHLWGGLTFEQVGELSGCSTSMAYRHYTAGVAALRDRMGDVPCPTKPPTGVERLRPSGLAARSHLPPTALDRDALLFAAGRAAQARSDRVWQLSTAILSLAAASLGATLVLRPAAVVERERLVYVQTPPPAAAPQPPPATPDASPPSSIATVPDTEWAEGLQLRQRLLQEGVAGLAPTSLAWSELPRPLSERDVPEISALHRPYHSSAPGGLFR